MFQGWRRCLQDSMLSVAVCLHPSLPEKRGEEEERQAWLEIIKVVSVPAASGLARGPLFGRPPFLSVWEWSCVCGGQRTIEWEGCCHMEYPELQRHQSRSAALTFICLIPKAIKQFSRETAAEIYICLVSTYQLSSVCVLLRVDSIFKSSVFISVWCQLLTSSVSNTDRPVDGAAVYCQGWKTLPSVLSSCVDISDETTLFE